MTDDPAPTMELNAVLFADLGDSTRLYERLGDSRAHQVASTCLEGLEDVVIRHGGRTVKHIGDGMMCVFADSNDAVRAARDMQQRIADMTEVPGMTIHVGLHWGPVLPEAGDVFGDAVNLAARVGALAHARQILTTDATVARLDSGLRAATRWIDRRHVKGKRGDIDLYEVIWERAEERTEFSGGEVIPQRIPELWVEMGEVSLQAGDARPAVTIGRDAASDLIIADQTASRRHAKIEMRGGKWVLTDHSINGTLLAPDGGQPVRVHNEQVLLPVAGWLGVGNAAADEQALRVRFRHSNS